MRNILDSLRRIPGHVWIIIGIGAVGLVIAYLSYRAQQANNASSTASTGVSGATAGVPAGGSSTPNYSSDPNAYGGYGYDYTSYELQQILALLQMQQGAQVPSNGSPSSGSGTGPIKPPNKFRFGGGNGNGGLLAPIATSHAAVPPSQGGSLVKLAAQMPISVNAARAGATLSAAAQPAPRPGTVATLASKMRSVNRMGG